MRFVNVKILFLIRNTEKFVLSEMCSGFKKSYESLVKTKIFVFCGHTIIQVRLLCGNMSVYCAGEHSCYHKIIKYI